jgi:hypothetical protein
MSRARVAIGRRLFMRSSNVLRDGPAIAQGLAHDPERRSRRAAGLLEVMLEMGVRRLPAVNCKGRVVGILSLDGVLIDLADQLSMVKDLLHVERARGDLDDQIID